MSACVHGYIDCSAHAWWVKPNGQEPILLDRAAASRLLAATGGAFRREADRLSGWLPDPYAPRASVAEWFGRLWRPRSKAERRGMIVAAAFCATYGPLSTWGPEAAVDAFGWTLVLLVIGGLSAYGGSRVSRAVNGAADPIAESMSRWVDEKLDPPPAPPVGLWQPPAPSRPSPTVSVTR